MTLTEFEKTLIDYLPAHFRYMARDKSGELYLYEMHPYKNYEKGKEGTWTHDCGDFEILAVLGVFESVRWDDDYPWNFRAFNAY